MEKAKKIVEDHLFQNFILAVIVLNAAIMGVLTAQHLATGDGGVFLQVFLKGLSI